MYIYLTTHGRICLHPLAWSSRPGQSPLHTVRPLGCNIAVYAASKSHAAHSCCCWAIGSTGPTRAPAQCHPLSIACYVQLPAQPLTLVTGLCMLLQLQHQLPLLLLLLLPLLLLLLLLLLKEGMCAALRQAGCLG